MCGLCNCCIFKYRSYQFCYVSFFLTYIISCFLQLSDSVKLDSLLQLNLKCCNRVGSIFFNSHSSLTLSHSLSLSLPLTCWMPITSLTQSRLEMMLSLTSGHSSLSWERNSGSRCVTVLSLPRIGDRPMMTPARADFTCWFPSLTSS